jgi:hypothetical protein
VIGHGLTWGGAVFMLASWGAILGLLVFCFSRLLGRR